MGSTSPKARLARSRSSWRVSLRVRERRRDQKRWRASADGWRAVEALRKPIRFQVHNLLEPPPHPGAFDIVLCRNVLLYLSPEKKMLAFERIASAMAEDGWLMLGAGETVIGQTNKLGSDVNARGLYRLTGDGGRIEKRRNPDRRSAAGA